MSKIAVVGKIYNGKGEPKKVSTILVEGSKISAVYEGRKEIDGAEVLDMSGYWITPGLIDAHTHLGLHNSPGVRIYNQDSNEFSNPITPQLRVMDSFNPHDGDVTVTRQAGFTTCCVLPGSANVCGGQGFSLKLKPAETVDEMVLPGSTVMKMAFGENPKFQYGYNRDRSPISRMATAALLRELLLKAKRYSDELASVKDDVSKLKKWDFGLQAMVPVVRGEMRCRIHCHRSDDMATAIRIAKEFNLKFSLEHASGGAYMTNTLRENHVTCVVGPMDIGYVKRELWQRDWTTPAKLTNAGVTVCLTRDESRKTGELLCDAGKCMAYGLSEEDAFKAVTINPARLLGFEDRIGSIEPGKDADLAFFNGHPFSNFTRCQGTMIEGVLYKE